MRRDTPAWEQHVAERDAEVEDCVSAVLAPIAADLIARLEELMRAAQPYRRALTDLLDAHRGGRVDCRPLDG